MSGIFFQVPGFSEDCPNSGGKNYLAGVATIGKVGRHPSLILGSATHRSCHFTRDRLAQNAVDFLTSGDWVGIIAKFVTIGTWSRSTVVKPILKWVGGKGRLLKAIVPTFPQYDRYIEPFLGGGSVLFHLEPNRAIAADINYQAIEFYQVIRDNLRPLIVKLRDHQYLHCKDHYYRVRNLDRLDSFKRSSKIDRAARLLYLNRAGFNGLYRVNSKGQNNVPYGGDNRRVKFDRQDLSMASAYLRSPGVELKCQDFEETIAIAQKGDLIYCDPPYDGTYNDYTESGFSWDDRCRLIRCLLAARRRGANFILSDSLTDRTEELYQSFNLTVCELSAPRAIAAKGDRRKPVTELLVCSVNRND